MTTNVQQTNQVERAMNGQSRIRFVFFGFMLAAAMAFVSFARAADAPGSNLVAVLDFDFGDSRRDWAEKFFGTPETFAAALCQTGVPAFAAAPEQGLYQDWPAGIRYLVHLGAVVPDAASYCCAVQITAVSRNCPMRTGCRCCPSTVWSLRAMPSTPH